MSALDTIGPGMAADSAAGDSAASDAAPIAPTTSGTGTSAGAAAGLLDLRLASIRFAAKDINILELVSPHGAELPRFTAGAHIDLHLRRGPMRPYPLCNDPAESDRYHIAVLRQPPVRGGSVLVHDELRCGALLSVSPPATTSRSIGARQAIRWLPAASASGR